ncbi:MAG TPA: hypothetical protein VG777_08595, partial [Thermoanaerobaculia bacterium]|nr:hypothetical protein [Thermoanaerobaculia bacterium]
MSSRAGWVLYLALLLAWVVAGVIRRRRAPASDPAGGEGRNRMLLLFVVGWALVLLAIAIV